LITQEIQRLIAQEIQKSPFNRGGELVSSQPVPLIGVAFKFIIQVKDFAFCFLTVIPARAEGRREGRARWRRGR